MTTQAGLDLVGVEQCVNLLLVRSMKERGVVVQRPFVGNRMCVTSLKDPDGYQLHFQSPTDAPEESEYEG